jgi:hypothetical protein
VSPAGSRTRAGGLLAAAVVAVAGTTGCQTTQDKSAALQAKAAATDLPGHMKVGRREPAVRLIRHRQIRGQGRTAVVVEVENRGKRPLRGVPVVLRVTKQGREQFANDITGNDRLGIRIPVLPPGRFTWINAEVPEIAEGSVLTVKLGAAQKAWRGGAKPLRVTGLKRSAEPETPDGVAVEGTVRNDGRRAQRDVPIFITAQEGPRTVAVATGRIERIAARGSAPFQAYLTGNGRAGRLRAVALPTSPTTKRSR